MHPDNGYYGHRRVLLDAAGVDDDVLIAAHVQHGWQLGTGLNDAPRLVGSLRKLVWGTRHETNARAAGIRNVGAIGAPFAYLVRDVRPDPVTEPEGTIFFPFHSWHRGRAFGSHEELARVVSERDGAETTVCLYHLEYSRPDVRRAYVDAGFRVVTAGPRDGNPDFLPLLLGELRRHERVAANHMGTAILYGGLVGLNAEVYGPTFSMEVLATDHHSRCRAEFPELHGEGGATPERARAIAEVELGVDRLLSPEELRGELGVDSSRSRRAVEAAWVFAEHHVRRAGAKLFGG